MNVDCRPCMIACCLQYQQNTQHVCCLEIMECRCAGVNVSLSHTLSLFLCTVSNGANVLSYVT